MQYILYKTVNKINGNFYIGVHGTNDLNDGYLGSGKALAKAIKKYGKENFEREILVHCDSYAEAYDLEEMVVDKRLVKMGTCYNACLGGKGGVGKSNDPEKQKYYGSLAGKKAVENGTGIFALSDEEKLKNCSLGGLVAGKLAVERGDGIHAQTPEERLELSKLGGKVSAEKFSGSINYTDGTKFFRYTVKEQLELSFEQFLEQNPQFVKGFPPHFKIEVTEKTKQILSEKRIGAKWCNDGTNNYLYTTDMQNEVPFEQFVKENNLNVGLLVNFKTDEDSVAKRKEICIKAGKIAGRMAVENRTGIFGLSDEDRSINAKKAANKLAEKYNGCICYTDGKHYLRYTVEEQNKLPFDKFLKQNPQFSEGMPEQLKNKLMQANLRKRGNKMYNDGYKNYTYTVEEQNILDYEQFLEKNPNYYRGRLKLNKKNK